MNKFLVTLVDGSQVLCYRADPVNGSNHSLARAIIIADLDPLLQGEASTERGLWHMGFSQATRNLTDDEASCFMDLPRCYLNTIEGQRRLRYLSLLAVATKTLQGQIA